MEWVRDHAVAVVLMLAYTVVLLYHARIGSRSSDSESGFFVAGRNLGGAAVGVSYFATFASTNSYVGNAGKGYEFGLPWLVMVLFMVAFSYLSWTAVAPRLRRFVSHWDALTLPDFLAARFGGVALRPMAGIVIAFASLLYVLAIFKGSGAVLQHFLGVPYAFGVWITFGIVILYTSIGGMVSVVRTDVVQGALMLIGAVVMFACVTRAAGGAGVILDMASRPDTGYLFTWNAGIPFVVLVGIALSGSLKLLVDPRQLSRFYALRDDRAVRVGVWVALGGIALIQLCLFPIGIYAHELLSGITDTDTVVPLLVNDVDVFPRWVGDFLIVAIVAAAMSSLDSVLLVAASVLSKDVLRRPNGVIWTRAGIVGFAFAGAALALEPPAGIVEVTVFSGSLYAVCFFPALIFGLHWRQGDSVAVAASMAVGLTVLIGWLVLGMRVYVHEVFPALGASVLCYLTIARLRPAHLDGWPATDPDDAARELSVP